MSYGNSWETDDKINRNPWSLMAFAIFLVIVLLLRLFSLQVLQYSNYQTRSESYRIKSETIEAPRGFIYDRNGNILAENEMSYSITVDPFERDMLATSIPRLATLVPNLPNLMKTSEDGMVEQAIEMSRQSNNPEKIISDADFNLLSIVEEYSNELPGLGGTFDQLRHYNYGPLAAHVIGYMGELTKDEYSRLKDDGYGYGHSIGKIGIERYYESTLKGSNGSKFVEMNYLSRRLGISADVKPIPPVPGKDLTLTLDLRLQIAAEEAFGDSIIGSLVALDPNNGDVLVMASSPTFDPNEFIHTMSRERMVELQKSETHPLYNRAIQATYPPGSPFKVLTALAGLENGYPVSTTFNSCHGVYYFGRPYKCWKEGGHGSLDMLGAITNSCNVYMYQLGRKITFDRWQSFGEYFGLGKRTGIDLYGENTGLFPTTEYYENSEEGFSPGKMLNLSIGQGEILTTVLQLAQFTSIIATEGKAATPHLVITERKPPRIVSEISHESFDVVKRGMHGVVHSAQGTAKSARVPGHLIAGKTGTAQNPHGADHKIFIAFAPYDDPQIAIACVAENAGDYPYSLAVRIVKKVLIEYFTYYPDTTVAIND